MKMKICMFIILFMSIVAEIYAKKCKYANLIECGMIRNKFQQEYGKAFPTNEKELNRQCELFEDMRNCIYNYSVKCMTGMDRTVGFFILSGAAQGMKDVCNPELQIFEDYLQEAECINNNYGPVKLCFKDIIASIIQMHKDTSGDKMLPFCCGLNRMKKCISDHYRNKCGEKAASVMDLQIEILISDWIIATCDPFLEMIKDCPPKPTLTDQASFKHYYFIRYLAPFASD